MIKNNKRVAGTRNIKTTHTALSPKFQDFNPDQILYLLNEITRM